MWAAVPFLKEELFSFSCQRIIHANIFQESKTATTTTKTTATTTTTTNQPTNQPSIQANKNKQTTNKDILCV